MTLDPWPIATFLLSLKGKLSSEEYVLLCKISDIRDISKNPYLLDTIRKYNKKQKKDSNITALKSILDLFKENKNSKNQLEKFVAEFVLDSVNVIIDEIIKEIDRRKENLATFLNSYRGPALAELNELREWIKEQRE